MIKIKKGLDLPIAGSPAQTIKEGPPIQHVAVLGQDYLGLRPILHVQEGDWVKKGQTLFEDKKNPGILFTAPACGKISTITRGERRVLQSVAIEIAGEEEINFACYDTGDLNNLSPEIVRANLVASGLWVALRNRPFSKSPPLNSRPRAIFVTAMDTQPLAANPQIIIAPQIAAFNDGLIILSRLTEGLVHVCHAPWIGMVQQAHNRITYNGFSGPHPAGLVGTHIHFLAPVSLTHSVWHIGYQDVIAIGKLFTTGKLASERIISLAGPQVEVPTLLRTCLGANLYELTTGKLKKGENRIISGSVLSGTTASTAYNYLGRFHQQISVLLEDRNKELFGWFMPGGNKYSITGTTLGHFLKEKLFAFSTNRHGGTRSMVPIGNYERVMPLDILATHLLRDLISGDSDSAQELGCLELDEEDLALCTFVCPAKYEYGPILRKILTQIEQEG